MYNFNIRGKSKKEAYSSVTKIMINWIFILSGNKVIIRCGVSTNLIFSVLLTLTEINLKVGKSLDFISNVQPK